MPTDFSNFDQYELKAVLNNIHQMLIKSNSYKKDYPLYPSHGKIQYQCVFNWLNQFDAEILRPVLSRYSHSSIDIFINSFRDANFDDIYYNCVEDEFW
jgi:hypothetical protein